MAETNRMAISARQRFRLLICQLLAKWRKWVKVCMVAVDSIRIQIHRMKTTITIILAITMEAVFKIQDSIRSPGRWPIYTRMILRKMLSVLCLVLAVQIKTANIKVCRTRRNFKITARQAREV